MNPPLAIAGETRSSSRGLGGLSLLPPVLVGIAVTAVASRLEEFSFKRFSLVAAALVPLLAGLYWRRPKVVFLFLWAALTGLYRPYRFPGLPDGLGWLPADACLAGLYLLWGYEAVVLKRHRAAPSPLWRWYVVWLCIILAASAFAVDAGRTPGEVLRMLKAGLILFYCRYNLRRREFLVCVAGLIASALVQAGIGVIQATTGKLLPEGEEGQWLLRGVGTLMHPNVLASYLLLLAPLPLALAMAARRTSAAVFFAGAFLLAASGIASTLSRLPWALVGCELVLVLTANVWVGGLPTKRALGTLIVLGAAAGLALLPLKNKIASRISGDFKYSVDFRTELAEYAVQIASQYPFLGAGPNNFTPQLAKRAPQYTAEALDYMDKLGEIPRSGFVVHNFYFLVLAETGLLGLGGLFAFCISAVARGARAFRVCRGPQRAAVLGLTVGMIGVFGHMITDFALWMEPVFLTFALAAGMLDAAARWPDGTRIEA